MNNRSEIMDLIQDAYRLAKTAHECCFAKSDIQVANAPGLAVDCIAKYTEAKALCRSDANGVGEEAVDLFGKFELFTNEILDDHKNGHSYQWVDIRFQELTASLNRYCLTVGEN